MIHRLVSVQKQWENGTSPATLHARGVNSSRRDSGYLAATLRRSTWAIQLAGRGAVLTGLLQPSVKRLASTRNKLLKTSNLP
jgi:hypothetical protein